MEPFLALFRDRVAAIVVGDPRAAETTYGPLIHPVALERVTARVARALADGARLAFGGEPLGGLYYPPTLFTDVPAGAEVLRTEVFGPVLTLQGFADEAQAIAMANDSDYGLAGAVWSKDLDKAMDIARRIETGTVWINQNLNLRPDTAFAGRKQSGFGVENGMEGLLEFMAPQAVYLARG